jgi:LPS-assembly protein
MPHVAARGRKLDPCPTDAASLRRVLLAGAALAALAPLPATAASAVETGLRGVQPVAIETVTAAPVATARPTVPAPAPAEAPVGEDGLGPRDIYFEADLVIDDRDAKTLTAQGSVEARYQGRVLRANEVVYNTEAGTAVARGDTVIVNADGTTQYADEVVLDDELRAGVATAFAARLQGNVTIAAGAAIRRNENVNELSKAIYTPCDICNEEGYKSPTWSVQASKIIQDRERRVVYFRNAVIRVKGVPVFYTPIFWHPDPSSERRSGLLSPDFRVNSRLGLSYEQPYLWVISPSADLTIAPAFSTKVRPFLNLSYRQRFWSGQMNIRAGSTYEQKFDGSGRFGNAAARSYLLGDGLFQLTDKWRWGFGLEYASDPTVLQRYGIDNVFVRRGPFTADSQRLISQAYTERQDQGSFLSVSAIAFQSLRVLQLGRTLASYETAAGAFPVVAPLIEARIDPQQKILGGRLRMLGHAVVLSRDQDATGEVTPAGILLNRGVDTRRASGQVDWRATATLANGMRVEPFVAGRGDFYSVDNPAAAKAKASFSRAIGTVGADFSWPFVRQSATSSVILEPLLQVALSPDRKPNSRVPNEDSIALKFDETNLLSTNRFTGFDLYEGGQRLNVGGRATFNWGAGRTATVLVGRSFRTDADPAFFQGSGLEGKSSDWVTSARVSPVRGLALFTRSRLDADSLRIRRQEAGVDFNMWRVSANVRYLYNERDITGVETQSLNFGGTLNLTRNWGVTAFTSQDLETGVSPWSQVSVFYQDECIRVDLIFTHDETFASTIVPQDSVRVRLTLATLGGQGR